MNILFQTLQRVAVILVRPKYPENIGFTARAMRNFGLTRLIVVGMKPENLQPIDKTATHNGRSIIKTIRWAESLEEVSDDFHLLIGATARTGRNRRISVLPADLAGCIRPMGSAQNVALVFGPEDRGLTNRELDLCGALTTIETAGFSSLNVSHAVTVLCYELFLGIMKDHGDRAARFSPRLATVREQQETIDALEEVLSSLDRRRGTAKTVARMKKLRTLLGRREIQARESRLIMALARELDDLLQDGCEASEKNATKL